MWTSGIVLIAVVLLTGTIVLGAPTTSKPTDKPVDEPNIKLGPPLDENDLKYGMNLTAKDSGSKNLTCTNNENKPQSFQNSGELAMNLPSGLWPTNQIPYVIEANMSPAGRGYVAMAVKAYDAKTCIRWIPRTNEANYVIFSNGQSCMSVIGMDPNGPQYIYLASHCIGYLAAVHEMMHALGYIHEHQRMDRDQYIDIMWQYIPEHIKYNYNKETGPIDLSDEPYDYNSIMHYQAYLPTGPEAIIVPKKPGQTLGNMDFSPSDLKRIQKHLCSKYQPSKPSAPTEPPKSITVPPLEPSIHNEPPRPITVQPLDPSVPNEPPRSSTARPSEYTPEPQVRPNEPDNLNPEKYPIDSDQYIAYMWYLYYNYPDQYAYYWYARQEYIRRSQQQDPNVRNPNIGSPEQDPNVRNPNISCPEQNPNIRNPVQDPNVRNPNIQSPEQNPNIRNPNIRSPEQNPNIRNPEQDPNIRNPEQDPNVKNPGYNYIKQLPNPIPTQSQYPSTGAEPEQPVVAQQDATE